MRILLATHGFPPRQQGGAEQEACRLARHLADRRHELQVICVDRLDRGRGELIAHDEQYDGLPVRRLSFNLRGSPSRSVWSSDNPLLTAEVRSHLLYHPTDLVHLFGGYLMGAGVIRAARECGTPIVVTLTDYWFICPMATLRRTDGTLCSGPVTARCSRCLSEEKRRFRLPRRVAPQWVDDAWAWLLRHRFWLDRTGLRSRMDFVARRQQVLREALNSVDAALCASQFLRDVYIGQGAAPEKLIQCRQGRDLPNRAQPRAPSEVLRLAYMGQISEHKGVHLLVQAMRRVERGDVRLAIYGEPSHSPRYTLRLLKLAGSDARIEFKGAFRPAQLSQVMARTDLVVVPSLWYENSPNVILEAFGHGVPVLVSNLGGMAEMVRDGVDGLHFEVGDVASLANRINWLAADRSRLQALAANIQPVKTGAQEADEVEAIYRQVVKAKESEKQPTGAAAQALLRT